MPLQSAGDIRVHSAVRRTATATAIILACALVGAPAVQAAPPRQPSHPAGYQAAPSTCFSGYGEPGDTVASFRAGVSGDAYVYCGSPSKGVIHIDADHTIDESGSDDDNFVNCVMNFSDYGKDVGYSNRNPNHYIVDMNLKNGKARAVYDVNSYEIITVFTIGGEGNDWESCANFPA